MRWEEAEPQSRTRRGRDESKETERLERGQSEQAAGSARAQCRGRRRPGLYQSAGAARIRTRRGRVTRSARRRPSPARAQGAPYESRTSSFSHTIRTRHISCKVRACCRLRLAHSGAAERHRWPSAVAPSLLLLVACCWKVARVYPGAPPTSAPLRPARHPSIHRCLQAS